MNVAVVGLWHLGSVTAACLASAGHRVVGLDFDHERIKLLGKGTAPLFEPGLDELLRSAIASGNLSFTSDVRSGLVGAEVVWVAYDTPVDDTDVADTEFVVERVSRLFGSLAPKALVLVSSQVPVGTTARLEQLYRTACPGGSARFGFSPENLRLGKAIDVFSRPDRVVIGLRDQADRERVTTLLAPFTDKIEWMSVESAEMTKHALNTFLAVSVTFANEIALLCERVGASAYEVARGLKTDIRIGSLAYVSPGAAFGGGTLARDVGFLSEIGAKHGLPMHLVRAIRQSNDNHKDWLKHSLAEEHAKRPVTTVAVWGLVYKAGTSTLRRSGSVEFCRWALDQGFSVRAHDPAVAKLPPEFDGRAYLATSPADALQGASVLVLATAWPQYATAEAATALRAINSLLVLDPTGFLRATVAQDPAVRYLTVGERT